MKRKELQDAIERASLMAKEGKNIEVLDLRSLVPLDTEAIIKAVKKCGRKSARAKMKKIIF